MYVQTMCHRPKIKHVKLKGIQNTSSDLSNQGWQVKGHSPVSLFSQQFKYNGQGGWTC